jgi:hypothetical protein
VTSMSEQIVYRMADPPGDPFGPGHGPAPDPDPTNIPEPDRVDDPVLDPLESDLFGGIKFASRIQ